MDRIKINSNIFLHEALTKKIIEVCFEVANELEYGFNEGIYKKSLKIALEDKALTVRAEAAFDVFFRGRNVGDFRADLVIEEKVVIETKTVKTLLPEHQAQVINYLKASGIDVGLLLNFGMPRIEYRRLYRPGIFD